MKPSAKFSPCIKHIPVAIHQNVIFITILLETIYITWRIVEPSRASTRAKYGTVS